MYRDTTSLTSVQQSILAKNQVLRNTYILLSISLIFSAGMAWFAMATNAPSLGLMSLFVYIGLMFAISATRNSIWGLVLTFVFTGFLGYSLGPILNMMLSTYANGGQIIMTALGATGIIFLALSGYALTTKKDFSYLGGFIFAAAAVGLLLALGNIFFQIPGLQLIIAGAFALISAGLILFETSQIINGGERNYIMATIGLYIALYNLFVSLLQLLGAFGGRE